MRELAWQRSFAMPKKRFSPEQIVVVLRQIEVLMSQGKAAPVACREAGISQQSYYRWRKEYGGLEVDQAKRMKELERENIDRQRLRHPQARHSIWCIMRHCNSLYPPGPKYPSGQTLCAANPSSIIFLVRVT